MTMTHLLFDDEGTITRRQWWLGSSVLMAVYMLAGFCVAKWLGHTGLDRAIMLFVSIAILLPFFSVNAKRFRAIGRSPSLALVGAFMSALATLSGDFLPLMPVNTGLGIILMLVIVWYTIDLGLVDHNPIVEIESRAR
ncbi:MAG: DUF805 domain-containing protein [Beijerinckiaceae bacterium]